MTRLYKFTLLVLLASEYFVHSVHGANTPSHHHHNNNGPDGALNVQDSNNMAVKFTAPDGNDSINGGPVPRIKKRVAVIGAGSAGSSAAYYLKKYACPETFDLEIDIFERENHVGGRSTTVDVYGVEGKDVELGASIFVEVNKNLVDAAREFGLVIETSSGLSKGNGGDSDEDDKGRDAFAVWDGESIIYRQSQDGNSWWDNVKLLWKYGISPLKTQRLMNSTIMKFLKLYEPPLFPFKSLTEVAEAVDLLDATAHTGEQFLEANGVSVGSSGGTFATDLVQASTRVNYGQNLGLIHGLETMVCMAAGSAMAIKGGNWQIFKGMVDASKAKLHLSTPVTSLTKNSKSLGRGWTITAQRPNDVTVISTYDTVILASPLQFTGISISPLDSTKSAFTSSSQPDQIPYVTLHVHLFTSPLRISPSKFNLPPTSKPPLSFLTTLPRSQQGNESFTRGEGANGVGKAGFWSISTLRTELNPATGGKEYVYKIFSPKELSTSNIVEFLDVPTPEEGKKGDEAYITWHHHHVWKSYPYLYPRVTFENIILDEEEGDASLWYTSGIESFISTMETSSLMGMNVARGVVDGWMVGAEGTGDAPEAKKEQKEEGREELKVKAKL